MSIRKSFLMIHISRWPVCGTCEYWVGERDLRFYGGKLYAVMVEAPPAGRCMAHNNVHMNGGCSAKSCSAYNQWHKLP